jgi:hypothetical protein
MTGCKPIAVLLQSISGVSAINPLVAFYDEERERCYSFILSRTPHETIWLQSTFNSHFNTSIPNYVSKLSVHRILNRKMSENILYLKHNSNYLCEVTIHHNSSNVPLQYKQRKRLLAYT